jgi:hypothetical protein
VQLDEDKEPNHIFLLEKIENTSTESSICQSVALQFNGTAGIVVLDTRRLS